MPKLERIHQPIFGSEGNNDEFAVFGSMKSGTPVYSKTLSTLFQSPAFLQGWQNAVAADKAPFLEEMNALFLVLSQQIAYQFQAGLPEWDLGTTYYANTSFCQVNGVIYQSLTDENIGNNPTEDTTEANWKKIDFGGGSGYAHNLGDIIISPHKLTGPAAAYTAEQGTYTLSTDTAYYAHCLERKEAGTEQTITIGEYSFTGYVYNDDEIYYDISEKPTIDSIYDATGKAFYYGIDTQNQRIFLPRLKNVFLGMGDLTDTIRIKGNGMALGYTNGTLKFGTNPINSAGQGSIAAYTSLYKTKVGTVNSQTTQYSNGAIGLDPDSKYSGAVVDGQTITDNAQPAYLYFCVGNALVNTANIDVEKVIGDVRNLENNKAGQWQPPENPVRFEKLTVTNTPLALDISAAFPDDNYTYMVNVAGTISASAAGAMWDIYTQRADNTILSTMETRGYLANSAISQGGMLVVSPENRKIYMKNGSIGTLSNGSFAIQSVWRLGK